MFLLPPGAPPLPSRGPPPGGLPADEPAPPAGALDCNRVVMAVRINMLLLSSGGQRAVGSVGTVVDRLIGDHQICSSMGSSSSLLELMTSSGKMGTF